MIIQTKRATDALLKAGYTRDEIRVRTPKVNGYYQDTIIIVFATPERQRELAPKVEENGLKVIWKIGNFELRYPNYEL